MLGRRYLLNKVTGTAIADHHLVDVYSADDCATVANTAYVRVCYVEIITTYDDGVMRNTQAKNEPHTLPRRGSDYYTSTRSTAKAFNFFLYNNRIRPRALPPIPFITVDRHMISPRLER